MKLTMTMTRTATVVTCAALLSCVAAISVAAEPDEKPQEASLRIEQAEHSRAPGGQLAPLDAWRAIKQQAEAAMRLEDEAEKIAALRAFADEHPDWYEIEDVLEALVDTQVEQESFDAEQVARDALRLARANESSYYHPFGPVNDVFLRHELPVDPALASIEEGRRRVARERKDLATIEDDKERERTKARLDYYKAYASILEAEVRLLHGEPKKALTALAAASDEMEALERNYLLVDAEGREALELASGLDDRRLLLEAVSHLELGDRTEAARAADDMLGFFSRTRHRDWLAELEDQLGRTPDVLMTATGDPRPAPDFTLERLDGSTVSLSDMRGQVVIIAFWATWCGPCLKELPVLQRFYEEHRDEGIELLAINTDRFEMRASVEPFLEEQNIDVPVAFEKEEELTGYDYRAIPALYVVDKEGKIAEARTGYDPELEEKLSSKILKIARGGETPGRELFQVHAAPDGYEILWQRPVTGQPDAIAVAPGHDGAPGEIGALLRSKLVRWSASGEEIGATPQQGWWRALEVADLDQSGSHEWILGGFRDVKVLDQEGEVYWEYSGDDRMTLVGTHDLQGDGLQEILCLDGERLIALRHLPETSWETEDFDSVERARLEPDGEILVQDEVGVHRVDTQGAVTHDVLETPGALRVLSGVLRVKGGNTLTVFEGPWDPTPRIDHDLNGDGINEIIIPDHQGVIAYDLEGREVLRIEGNDVDIEVAAGNLDGKPGDELVLFVKQYGMVALGTVPQKSAAR